MAGKQKKVHFLGLSPVARGMLGWDSQKNMFSQVKNYEIVAEYNAFPLRQFTMNNGIAVTEAVQNIIERGGDQEVFTALKDNDGNWLKVTLWSHEGMEIPVDQPLCL